MPGYQVRIRRKLERGLLKLPPDVQKLFYRFVACWTCRKNEIVIEVYYVGSREKAPY